MTLLLDAPSATAAPAATRRRPVLPRLLAVGGVLLVAVALVLSVPRASGAAVTGAPVVVDGPPLTTLAAYGPAGSHVLGYEHGARFVLQVPVRNDGLLPTTVTSAALEQTDLPLLSTSLDAPLRLGPGQEGLLRLTASLGNCRYYHEREVQVHRSVTLEQQVLGLSATAVVPLDRPVIVHSPMIVGCPERKLDRQAFDKDGFRGFSER